MSASRMRPIHKTIPLDEARAIIAGACAPLTRTERLGLGDADGRVVSADVVARTDVPPFARAAMDGYAVRSGETAGATRERPRTLRRTAILYTGQAATTSVGPRRRSCVSRKSCAVPLNG